ncbi:hypothetical protein ACLB2K_014885 [Fragaria x ananassa]
MTAKAGMRSLAAVTNLSLSSPPKPLSRSRSLIHSPPNAHHLFDKTSHRDPFEYTRLLFHYTRNDRNHDTISLFVADSRAGLPVNGPVLSSVAKACGSLRDQVAGRQVHCQCVKSGLGEDVSVGTSFVDMYMKSSEGIVEGRRVFDEMRERNVVSWTSLISGYAWNGWNAWYPWVLPVPSLSNPWVFSKNSYPPIAENGYTHYPKLKPNTYFTHRYPYPLVLMPSLFDIAVGTAKGLAYLHEECLEWVLHCDVKPQNILLDSNYQPKVADFGLSKLLNRDELKNSSFSRKRGTRGYIAPEWVYNLPITSKVDVYSYGVVVLEMVTGKNPAMVMEMSDGEQRRLTTWVREKLNGTDNIECRIGEIIDPSFAGNYDVEKMEILLTVALHCVEEDKDSRPTMSQVVERLLHHGKDSQ